MTTETQQPNDEAAADAAETGADTALGAAATASEETAAEGADSGDADVTNTDKAESGDQAGEGKGEAEQPQGAPEAYDTAAFKMPEGIEFDTEGFAAVEPVLRDLNLSQDQAGKLMSAYAEKIVPMIEARTLKAQDDAAAELRANLARDLQADPEVGGKKLEESRSFAAKAIAHFIPKADERSEFSTFLNESGLGNDRFLMRIVSGAGRVLAEASTPAAETSSAPLTESEKFYGKRGK
jgi:hypothetical protein